MNSLPSSPQLQTTGEFTSLQPPAGINPGLLSARRAGTLGPGTLPADVPGPRAPPDMPILEVDGCDFGLWFSLPGLALLGGGARRCWLFLTGDSGVPPYDRLPD